MATDSQFLYFYIDELIKHHWVDWVEGPLSSVPSPNNLDYRGFQKELGDLSAGPRTRAGEAYKLGILSGTLIRPQAAKADFPAGWQSVINGHLPSTKLGNYSYVIGKALAVDQADSNLKHALACLASILILHIGFKIDGRWYCTVLLFQYALNQLEVELGRKATDFEVRYLSAAVFSTLNSNKADFLVDPYKENSEIKKLLFHLTSDRQVDFKFKNMMSTIATEEIGQNDFVKTKASLFWAAPRGIYSLASSSTGISLIQELLKVDIELCANGEENLIAQSLEAISTNSINPGVFQIAEEKFPEHPNLYSAWLDLENELFTATNRAAELIDVKSSPDVWRNVQHAIRDSSSSQAYKRDGFAEEVGRVFEVEDTSKGDIGISVSGTSADDEKRPRLGRRKKFATVEDCRGFIESQLGSLEFDPPTSLSRNRKANLARKPKISRVDYAARDEANRSLGQEGEQFVLEYEKHRLTVAGKGNLAKMVAWSSKELGDGLGYDIKSFDLNGNEIFIEVKTTSAGKNADFYLSQNEVVVSIEKSSGYRLYRVFDFDSSPKLYVLNGSLEESVALEPISYRARVI